MCAAASSYHHRPWCAAGLLHLWLHGDDGILTAPTTGAEKQSRSTSSTVTSNNQAINSKNPSTKQSTENNQQWWLLLLGLAFESGEHKTHHSCVQLHQSVLTISYAVFLFALEPEIIAEPNHGE